jgi:aminoglycoside phosphotransferase (APT) family kinase protein
VHERGRRVTPLGEGTDHVTYLVDEELVARFAKGPDAAAAVEREARLLAAVAAISPVAVPEPIRVHSAAGCLVYRRLPGVPLLEVREESHAEAIAATLGTLLATLHTAAHLRDLVEPDEFTPREWQAEAAEHYAAVREAVPPAYRPAIEDFLAVPAPDPQSALVFSHNDLGIEHVLVDPGSATVTGVIDWSDAALVDPARDFGLLCRDLGPAALDAALASHGGAAELRDRALFHARCTVFEDLAYGIQNGRPPYAEKSLAGLAWLFPPGS